MQPVRTESLCSELQRRLAVLGNLHADVSTQAGDSQDARAPDAHPESARVFMLCPDQLGGAWLLVIQGSHQIPSMHAFCLEI